MASARALTLFAVLALGACGRGEEGGAAPLPSTAPVAPPPASSAAPAASPLPSAFAGSSIARTPAEDLLIVADEDRSALRLVPLPLGRAPAASFFLPGRPAQVVAFADHRLVTLRDVPEGGGALLVMKRGPGLDLAEVGRVALPADAWGLAVSPDATWALVSSPFSGVVTRVELTPLAARVELAVAREPRGLTISADGDSAYVSHLVGSGITRLEGLRGPSPKATYLEFPASPLRAGRGERLPASLGYAVVPSPNGERLFFPRLALGAQGPSAWAGTPAVDVWLPRAGAPLVPTPNAALPLPPLDTGQAGTTTLVAGASAFAQPRAALYRAAQRTLLVACEGTDRVVELDALMTDPTLGVVRGYPLGGSCGAPTGLAFSRDEATLYVHCRTTDAVTAIPLIDGEGQYVVRPPLHVELEPGALRGELARGRALFYDATDPLVSGGLACSGCHPEGRDDGHVWHEVTFRDAGREVTITNFLGGPGTLPALHQDPEVPSDGYGCGATTDFVTTQVDEKTGSIGHPRQTPMLAGRVDAEGPFGWHGESPTLAERIRAGFGLHRWRAGEGEPGEQREKAELLALFLRKGLVAPPRGARPLTAEEARGKALFESPETRCAGCHVSAGGFTDRAVVALGEVPIRPGFVAEEDLAFKTPSLLYVGHTPPYFHDGREATLESLIEKNADRMGKTSHLSAPERAALVAYLRTL